MPSDGDHHLHLDSDFGPKSTGLFDHSVIVWDAEWECNEWISLAFIKLGIDTPEAVIDRAFVENRSLVPKTAN